MTPLRQALDQSRFGGKAVQLAHALSRGLPVPDGMALSHGDVAAFAERPDRTRVGSFTGPVAVRSSAIGEDSAGASFAGQHETILGATGAEAIERAILEVYRSAFNEAALAYRQKMSVAGAPRMGIVIQSLVRAEVAGVLFTVNPATGADERVIEASWGLGEMVVQGRVVPDHFRVARGGRVLASTAGEKDVALRYASDQVAREEEVSPEDVARLCLSAAQLQRLDELASRCEVVFGGQQDIEWAFEADRLYLLQRRPITTPHRGGASTW
jgi:pyruvate,water dikinase